MAKQARRTYIFTFKLDNELVGELGLILGTL